MFDKISKIFNENKDKRICVIGTTCTGKSTIIRETQCGEDMDEAIFPLLTEEETDYVCSTPWTEEIGAKMDELVRTKLSIIPGCPMFGTVLLDCDLIVYLHISDDLLKERCLLRSVDFENAKNMQNKIEEEISNSNIDCIRVEVENFIKTK
jgi:hypothetical protein